MESQQYGAGKDGREKQLVMVANETRLVKGSELVLRFMSFALTLGAAVILGVDKQTKMVATSLVPTLPDVNVPVTAKWHYMSAFVYFVVVNAIACAYAAISVILFMLTNNKGTKKSLSLMIIIFDLMMVALLFSGGGAAIAVGLIGHEGNSHAQWGKVCDVFGRFCSQVAAAVVISLLAAALFFLMVLLTTFKLHNRKA